MKNEVTIQPAGQKDIHRIQSLLAKSDLPIDDVEEHLQNFLVAKQSERIIGTVGLEIYGSSALLRSLAVAEEQRSQGVAKSLYDKLVAYAASKGVHELSLLTTAAEGYFARLGFEKVPKERIPTYVKQTKEYRFFCPSNAVCMLKKI